MIACSCHSTVRLLAVVIQRFAATCLSLPHDCLQMSFSGSPLHVCFALRVFAEAIRSCFWLRLQRVCLGNHAERAAAGVASAVACRTLAKDFRVACLKKQCLVNFGEARHDANDLKYDRSSLRFVHPCHSLILYYAGAPAAGTPADRGGGGGGGRDGALSPG